MSEAFKQFTLFQPMQTTTTSTIWSGWRTVSPKCYLCVYCAMRCGIPVCWCVSRTMKSDGTCLSYFGRDAE